MSVAAFLTAALESALDNDVATPEDLLRHATPDVLATHVPRAVWARLLATCLSAPRLDARIIVDTIGVSTLCQHVPVATMWACLAEISTRALGRGLVAAPPSVVAASSPVLPPPPPVMARVATPPRGTAVEAGRAAAAAATGTPPRGTLDAAAEVTRVAHPPPELSKLAAEKSETRGELTRVVPASGREPEPLGEPPAPPRAPGATTRAAATTQPPAAGRRPQASASAAAAAPASASPLGAAPPAKAPRGTPSPARRVSTATDFEIETDVNEQWKRTSPPVPGAAAVEIPVDDEQLVDWTSAEETATSGDKYGDRKR